MNPTTPQLKHWLLLTINLLLIVGFGFRFAMALNYEFAIYVGVIIFFLGLIYISFKRVAYSYDTLCGLTIWSLMHLAGGGISVGEGRLYDVILLPLSSTYPIFRYDQLVHIFGFGTTTLLMFDLLSSSISRPLQLSIGASIVLVMAGLGAGALNEIVEFIVNEIVPSSGVGGYLNTALDLCSNLVGALLAWLYLKLKLSTQSRHSANSDVECNTTTMTC